MNMEDRDIVDEYVGDHMNGSRAYGAWIRIWRREGGEPLAAARDFETVGDVIGRHKLPDDVDDAWCRIVARERARMGLPDLDTERSAAVLFLAEVGTATADDLVDAGVYCGRDTAAAVLAWLTKQGRIRRVSRGMYAWGGGA